jgi:hypothetical protein
MAAEASTDRARSQRNPWHVSAYRLNDFPPRVLRDYTCIPSSCTRAKGTCVITNRDGRVAATCGLTQTSGGTVQSLRWRVSPRVVGRLQMPIIKALLCVRELIMSLPRIMMWVGAGAYPDFSRTGKVALCEPITPKRESLSLSLSVCVYVTGR